MWHIIYTLILTDFKSTYLPHTVCQQSEALNVDPVKKNKLKKVSEGVLILTRRHHYYERWAIPRWQNVVDF